MLRQAIQITVVSALSLGGCARSDNTQSIGQSLNDAQAEIRRLSERLCVLEERNQETCEAGEDLRSLSQWVQVEAQTPPEYTCVQHISPVVDDEAYALLSAAADAYRTKLTCIASNLANAETIGYKRLRADLATASPAADNDAGAPHRLPQKPGKKTVPRVLSVRVAHIRTEFTDGAFQLTNGQLDLAIDGRGFFRVSDPNGETLYTRAGNFSINADGLLLVRGRRIVRLLSDEITIPSDAIDIVVSPDGIVSVRQHGNPQLTSVGQITLAQFTKPEGLLALEDNVYEQTEDSGDVTVGIPSQNGLGYVRQSVLEASNVDITAEVIEGVRTVRILRTVESILLR